MQPTFPPQYNAAKPAPFMIFLDGSGSLNNNVRVPVVFDNLIASGDLPPLIGIFVDPGILPAGFRHRAESLRARVRIRLIERPLLALPVGGTDSRGG
jgi:enterochelin esterase-like enzyme